MCLLADMLLALPTELTPHLTQCWDRHLHSVGGMRLWRVNVARDRTQTAYVRGVEVAGSNPVTRPLILLPFIEMDYPEGEIPDTRKCHWIPRYCRGRSAVHTQATFLPLWTNRTSSTVAYARRSRHSIVALPRAAEHRDTRTRPPQFRERTYRSTVCSGSRRQHSTSLKTMTSKRSSGE
jgi:hypothetical protein